MSENVHSKAFFRTPYFRLLRCRAAVSVATGPIDVANVTRSAQRDAASILLNTMAKEGFVTRAISLYVPWPDKAGTEFDQDAIYDGVNNIGKALEKICAAKFNHFDNVNCKHFRNQLQYFIETCEEANPKPHQAIVYICTHGIVHPKSKEIYLMMNDSPNPDSDLTAFFAKSIPGKELRKYMDQLQEAMPHGKVLVLLDCCHAGALIERDETLGYTDVRKDAARRAVIQGGRGLVYFVSCRRSEESRIALDDPCRGLHFTNAVANVLMEAPKGEVIKLTELVRRVKSEVEASSEHQQHPVEYPACSSEQGQLYKTVGLGDGEEEIMDQDETG